MDGMSGESSSDEKSLSKDSKIKWYFGRVAILAMGRTVAQQSEHPSWSAFGESAEHTAAEIELAWAHLRQL